MEDTATPQPSDTNNPDDHSSARSGAEEHSPGRSLSTYARPALIAGVVIAVVCVALLIVIFALDAFNAAAYSVSGKNIGDATDEARDIRELHSGARAGGNHRVGDLRRRSCRRRRRAVPEPRSGGRKRRR
ncbi:hypothetical protein AAHB34_15125 [Paenarthrobacter ureafaciens]